MAMFWKAIVGALIAVILCLAVGKQQKDLSLILNMAVCCMVCLMGITYLEPVLEFLRELEALGGLQKDMLGILLKAVGISLTAEISGMICADGGNASLGQAIRILANALVLYLSLPIMRTMLDLVQKILGAL